MSTNKQANRLIHEKSPYLLQHAYNPVNWFPWSDEAFEKARLEDKPVFLSIGYSTCHWCHVMERESFENQEVALILNRAFISIKVDREERPDIDQIYMAVCQTLTGSGGWPLSVFLTPEKKPFFAGTYFPREDQYGSIGFISLLKTIEKLWKDKKNNIINAGDEVLKAVNESYFNSFDVIRPSDEALSLDIIHMAYKMLEKSFDKEYGGFGSAPKFPSPHNILFLLRYWHIYGCDKALEIACHTLKSMYKGGIYDHIGFGFGRYSTDNKWLVPHFEKMLYDNALLSLAFLETYQATRDNFYKLVANEIFTYILRDMTSPDGAFYSAEDADAEGVEGKFYIWSRDEIIKCLGEEEGRVFCDCYNISDAGNFEGLNIPNLVGKADIELYCLDRFKKSRDKLFALREERVHPFKDDKILTSWNGLMIAALALAGRILESETYTKAAEKASDFILMKLRNNNGRLLARFRDGDASILGYAEDYAYFIYGLIELFQTTQDARYLKNAISLNDDFVDLFWDKENGGFYQYGSDGEQLIIRPKEIYDGAIPSANSQAAHNFLKLFRITGSTDMHDKAVKIFKTFYNTVREHPLGCIHLISAMLFDFSPSREIIITGLINDKSLIQMIKTANYIYAPFDVTIVKHLNNNNGISVEEVIPMLKGYTMMDNKATAYVCSNFSCKAPVTGLKELEGLLMSDENAD